MSVLSVGTLCSQQQTRGICQFSAGTSWASSLSVRLLVPPPRWGLWQRDTRALTRSTTPLISRESGPGSFWLVQTHQDTPNCPTARLSIGWGVTTLGCLWEELCSCGSVQMCTTLHHRSAHWKWNNPRIFRRELLCYSKLAVLLLRHTKAPVCN